jgi:hypothetical protein
MASLLYLIGGLYELILLFFTAVDTVGMHHNPKMNPYLAEMMQHSI